MAHSRTDHPLLFDCTPAPFSLQVVADTLTNARARAGTAATNYVEYCENADTMDRLRFKS